MENFSRESDRWRDKTRFVVVTGSEIIISSKRKVTGETENFIQILNKLSRNVIINGRVEYINYYYI